MVLDFTMCSCTLLVNNLILVCDCSAGSSADGRWTTWPWSAGISYRLRCLWLLSSSETSECWADVPQLRWSPTILSASMGRTSCCRPLWEVRITALCSENIRTPWSPVWPWANVLVCYWPDQIELLFPLQTYHWCWHCLNRQSQFKRVMVWPETVTFTNPE